MLQKQILHAESMNLCFDGSVMSGDVDIMWESICQVSGSQLVLVCNEPQPIAQIYTPCENKYIIGKRFKHCFHECSNCTTSSVAGFLFQSWCHLTVFFEDNSNVVLHKGADVEQYSWRVDGAEAELDVVCRVVVAEAEVVVVRVDPIGPNRFI